MVSRRCFLQAATVTAGTSLAALAPQLRAEERCAPLPPSIVSLKSMKDLAHPVTIDERAARLAGIRIPRVKLFSGSFLVRFEKSSTVMKRRDGV